MPKNREGKPRQKIRCRLFPPADHTPESKDGHGLSVDQGWVTGLYKAVDAWAIDLHLVGPNTSQERLRHFRMAQQIAEDLVVIAEAEGEKLALVELCERTESQALEHTRSLKFIVDGQLDLNRSGKVACSIL